MKLKTLSVNSTYDVKITFPKLSKNEIGKKIEYILTLPQEDKFLRMTDLYSRLAGLNSDELPNIKYENMSLLYLAATEGLSECIDILGAEGISLTEDPGYSDNGDGGIVIRESALFEAVKKKHTGAIVALCKLKGLNNDFGYQEVYKNGVVKVGMSSLFLAQNMKSSEITGLLLDAGFNVQHDVGSFKKTPANVLTSTKSSLYRALEINSMECTFSLMISGRDVLSDPGFIEFDKQGNETTKVKSRTLAKENHEQALLIGTYILSKLFSMMNLNNAYQPIFGKYPSEKNDVSERLLISTSNKKNLSTGIKKSLEFVLAIAIVYVSATFLMSPDLGNGNSGLRS
ncbi:hypothetical protein HOG98_05780 [bacterium]|jgi:hypothetical protein|nr:hypothetical protein [bacterium]